MKKILTATQIREADNFTIIHEPVSSLLLMERAAHSCFQWLRKHYESSHIIKIFCGTGNNGGDGLVIADYFLAQQTNVSVYIVRFSDNSSADFTSNENRLMKNYPNHIFNIKIEADFPDIEPEDLVIDALFGTGINKPPAGIASQLIKYINASQAQVVAIDMPSGLFADVTSAMHADKVIGANHTLTFQLKKLAFYFPENGMHCGDVHVMDIKLNQRFIDNCDSVYHEIEKADVQQIIKPRNAFAHKGTFGHALIMSGSYGKMGAAVLATKACLRSGAGLVTANIPQCGYSILQTAVPETMVIADKNENYLTAAIDYTGYDAIGIGPGIGNEKETIQLLIHLLKSYHKTIVIDADAINIIAKHKDAFMQLRANAILTPHIKEFERLTEKARDDFHRNELQRNFSIKNKCYIVLKGHYTCISTPDGICYFNTTGNPGMATGGSGDVLTGILTGLLAQGFEPLQSCIAGVYLHGIAGDIAADKLSQPALLASDIIAHIGDAYLALK